MSLREMDKRRFLKGVPHNNHEFGLSSGQFGVRQTNPEGIVPRSPGLSQVRRGTTLGKPITNPSTPNGVVPSPFAETIM